MATLEDKILGEKKDYYCSSSEDEGDNDSDQVSDSEAAGGGMKASAAVPQQQQPVGKWEGSSQNTGPKGVIKDWQRFKQLEIEKRQEQEVEKLELAKKLCLTMTNPEPANQKQEEEDPELAALMNDDQFLEEFRKQRMQEMMIQTRLPKFGHVFHLSSGEEFLRAIDEEDKSTTVIVHIYEENVKPCKIMNQSLAQLAKQYPNIKFCRMVGSSAGMSHRFKIDGVPALIVYKEGNVIGNFVRITDELGDEFFDGDVENFLIENGIIFDRFCVPEIVQKAGEDEDAGSDWSLD